MLRPPFGGRLFEAADRFDMRRRIGKSRFHRVKRQVRRAEFFPRLNLFDPSLRRTLAERNSPFDADGFGIAARGARVGVDRIDHRPALFIGSN